MSRVAGLGRFAVGIAASLACAACPDTGGGSTADAGAPTPGPDAATAGPDAGCVPLCSGRTCGPDGCGGQCGACRYAESCDPSDACVSCAPDCTGKGCDDDDGCGGKCALEGSLDLKLVAYDHLVCDQANANPCE